VVCGYHFRLLEELRFGAETPPCHRLSIPYFLLQSLIDTSIKVQEENSHQLAHHGLIRILIEYSFQNLRIPIQWFVFRDMQVEEDIKSLTYDVSLTISEEDEEETEGEEEEEIEGDEDEMDEEEDETEENEEDEEEEEKEKDDDEETEEDYKEETDKEDEDLQEEEERKDIGEERNGKEGEKDKEESLGVSQNPLRESQQLPSLLLAPPSSKKAKDRGRPPYISRQGKAQE